MTMPNLMDNITVIANYYTLVIAMSTLELMRLFLRTE